MSLKSMSGQALAARRERGYTKDHEGRPTTLLNGQPAGGWDVVVTQ